MTKRKAPPTIQEIGIPPTGEVRAAVLKVFEEVLGVDVKVTGVRAEIAPWLNRRADEYERLAYIALKERIAPEARQAAVADQISEIGAAAKALVRALLASGIQATTSLNEAMKSAPCLPDHSWYETGELLGRKQNKRGPPSVEEMDWIVARFADRARNGALANDPLYCRAPVAEPPTLAQLGFSTLWLAVVAEVASPEAPEQSSRSPWATVHKIARNAVADFEQVTRKPANRSSNRNEFPHFLEKVFEACRLGSLGVKSTSYVQAAIAAISRKPAS